jgi:hypothetical protein
MLLLQQRPEGKEVGWGVAEESGQGNVLLLLASKEDQTLNADGQLVLTLKEGNTGALLGFGKSAWVVFVFKRTTDV